MSKTETPPSTPKAETPKTEANPFNPFANPFAAFDPMAFWSQSQQTFQKAMSDAFGRTQSFADQYAALEAQFVTRAQAAVANWAQLTQDAIAYGAQLSAEARKLSFDAYRKMAVA
jgi:hypothetical protein